MPLDSAFADDRPQDVGAASDCKPDDFKLIRSDFDSGTVFYLLDNRNRHETIVVGGNDAEQLLTAIFGKLSRNHAVKIIPGSSLLTAKEAATILQTSLQNLDRIEREGKLRFSKHGLQTVIDAEQVFVYKEARAKLTAKVHDELIGMDQDMYYFDG